MFKYLIIILILFYTRISCSSILLENIVFQSKPPLLVKELQIACGMNCNDNIIYSCDLFPKYISFLDDIIKQKYAISNISNSNLVIIEKNYTSLKSKYDYTARINKLWNKYNNIELVIMFCFALISLCFSTIFCACCISSFICCLDGNAKNINRKILLYGLSIIISVISISLLISIPLAKYNGSIGVDIAFLENALKQI